MTIKMAATDFLFAGKAIAVVAFLLRLVLLVWGRIQDEMLDVKFTDVDYFVFTDAARFVTMGESPFLRDTYRYSPLISFLLVPNVILWKEFGKLLFSACDLLAGWLVYQIVLITYQDSGDAAKQTNGKTAAINAKTASIASCLWLFNPLVATVSVRGNAESLMSVLVLAVLFMLLKGHVFLAAILYGLSVHLKMYPVIYCVPIMMYLSAPRAEAKNNRWWCLLKRLLSLNRAKVTFAVTSTLVFSGLTIFFYVLYGEDYVSEAILYHFSRRDTRHNFSVYFYLFYLLERTQFAKILGFLVFLPQCALVFLSGVTLYRNLPLCWFVQTVLFVTFNKICTSQYFLWYLTLLPVVAPRIDMSLWRAAILLGAWFAAQGLWLGCAYLLEFQGLNVFLAVWASSMVFFVTNVFILADIVRCYKFTTTAKPHQQ